MAPNRGVPPRRDALLAWKREERITAHVEQEQFTFAKGAPEVSIPFHS